jgi:plastocyanin
VQITYRHLVAIATAVAAVTFLVTGVRTGETFFTVVGGIITVAAVSALAFDRWFAVVPGIVVGLAGVVHAPMLISMLEHPDSTNDFAPAVMAIFVGAAVVALGVTDLVGRKRRTGTVVAPVIVRGATTGLGALAIAVVASGVMSATRETTRVDASERAGALIVTYEGAKVKEKELKAQAGVATRIVVDNEDAFVHDFKLEGTDLRFDLGPNDEKAAEFTISAPGEYTYKCTLTGHGNMKGTLTVR